MTVLSFAFAEIIDRQRKFAVTTNHKRGIVMQEKYKAFIDGTDLQHHVESDGFGVVVYPSVDALTKHIAHDTTECGIAEIEIRFVRWAREPIAKYK
jgi:hypothetical protein